MFLFDYVFNFSSIDLAYRNIMGEGLGSLNMKELKQLENRLERGITRIRSKKVIKKLLKKMLRYTSISMLTF